MTSVTHASIAYAATQVSFVMFSSPLPEKLSTNSRQDLHYHHQAFSRELISQLILKIFTIIYWSFLKIQMKAKKWIHSQLGGMSEFMLIFTVFMLHSLKFNRLVFPSYTSRPISENSALSKIKAKRAAEKQEVS